MQLNDTFKTFVRQPQRWLMLSCMALCLVMTTGCGPEGNTTAVDGKSADDIKAYEESLKVLDEDIIEEEE